MSLSDEVDTYLQVDTLDHIVEEEFDNELSKDTLEHCFIQIVKDERIEEHMSFLLAFKADEAHQGVKETLDDAMQAKKSSDQLMKLPNHLKYAYFVVWY